ncbi:Elongation of fatty acids protein 2 [Balamuthia mandrillaris]
MGIKGLTQLLGDNCPEAVKENEVKNYFGRKVAIDASMALYAFLIAVRTETSIWLTDQAGETTSHLMGMWSRSLRLISYGLKPIYVFDGKAPTMKADELKKRSEKKREAQASLDEAKETGDQDAVRKLQKRTIHVTKKHTDESKKLLRLMGIPVVEAPCEAEAQCAALCRAGKVWATGTEDMDALTFGTPILLRHLNYSEAQKKPIKEIYLDRALQGLGLSMDEFIDFCILCGCDYCDTIKGIGPKTALKLIKKHRTIEAVLKTLDPKKQPIPENFNYEGARELFKQPEITNPDEIELKWTEPDEEGLLQFLVVEKGFNEDRVRKGIAKLKKLKGGAVQGRLDSFFGAPKRKTLLSSATASAKNSVKAEVKEEGEAKGKGKEKEEKGVDEDDDDDDEEEEAIALSDATKSETEESEGEGGSTTQKIGTATVVPDAAVGSKRKRPLHPFFQRTLAAASKQHSQPQQLSKIKTELVKTEKQEHEEENEEQQNSEQPAKRQRKRPRVIKEEDEEDD